MSARETDPRDRLSQFWSALPPPQPTPVAGAPSPDVAECEALWARYAMPEHIREHSRKVAEVAVWLGRRLQEAGVGLCLRTVQATALLHDLGKLYSISHGGNHTQLGAAWVVRETGQPLLGQGVLFHSWWPWELNLGKWPLPLLVQYADKRVMHDRVVDLRIRFADLLERYGRTELARMYISRSERDGLKVEQMLLNHYKVDPYAYTADCGRLVQ